MQARHGTSGGRLFSAASSSASATPARRAGWCPLILPDNGIVKGTEFKDNFNAGLAIQGDGARVSRVNTHHNGRYGLVVTMPCVGCPGPAGVVIEDSEIAFNNTRKLSVFDDAGGTKFVGSNGMIVRHNEVHDNYGMGLWWDGSNKNARVYGNRIYDNRNAGILYEISFGGTKIHHNKLIDNGTGDGTGDWTVNVQLGSPPRTGVAEVVTASRSTRTGSMVRRTPWGSSLMPGALRPSRCGSTTTC